MEDLLEELKDSQKEVFVSSDCSPISSNNGHNSCISYDLLKKIAMILNDSHEIDCDIDISLDADNLHSEISKIMKEISDCKKEACWVTFDMFENNLSSEDMESFRDCFKPLMPQSWKTLKEWLSTRDIEQCLNQYNKLHKDFVFIGAVPIDFQKCSVSRKLCSFDTDNYFNNGIRKIAIVFNTDTSKGGGEHWISLFIRLRNKTNSVYFFDSYGKPPPEQIEDFIEGIKNKKRTVYLYNNKSYQEANNQCGIFCIHFIINMIKGLSFKKYRELELSDELMRNNRKIFFINYK